MFRAKCSESTMLTIQRNKWHFRARWGRDTAILIYLNILLIQSHNNYHVSAKITCISSKKITAHFIFFISQIHCFCGSFKIPYQIWQSIIIIWKHTHNS